MWVSKGSNLTVQASLSGFEGCRKPVLRVWNRTWQRLKRKHNNTNTKPELTQKSGLSIIWEGSKLARISVPHWPVISWSSCPETTQRAYFYNLGPAPKNVQLKKEEEEEEFSWSLSAHTEKRGHNRGSEERENPLLCFTDSAIATWPFLQQDCSCCGYKIRTQELCESRGGRPGLLALISLRFLLT